MKSIGDLFKELGFRPDSNVETQKAFVKNLIREANSVVRPVALKPVEKSIPGEQLSFDFETNSNSDKKSVS